MHKRTVAIAALAAAATIVGALVLVPSALSGVALSSEAPEPSAAAVTIDFAPLPYTNGLAAEQEAAAAASERARLEAEAAEAARVAAEAAVAQAAADEAARVAAEQAWAEQVAAEEAEAAAEQAAAEEAAAQPSVDPCIVVADAEGNYYPCGCHDLSCSYR